jgi:uncharacterized membrane protein YphA (DoxX/SURF4 family)
VGNRWRLVREVVLWVFALFLAWVFIRQGMAKFSDTSGWARAFRVWHYPVWFRIAVGVVETAAALLLLWRPTALAGAVLIGVVMIGAMATHVYWGHPGQVTSEVMPLTLAILVAIGRRASFLRRRPPERIP